MKITKNNLISLSSSLLEKHLSNDLKQKIKAVRASLEENEYALFRYISVDLFRQIMLHEVNRLPLFVDSDIKLKAEKFVFSLLPDNFHSIIHEESQKLSDDLADFQTRILFGYTLSETFDTILSRNDI